MDLSKLGGEFPNVKTRPGPGNTTLSYIDARQLQNRLDEVVGPENWQNEYKLIGEHLVCRIGIRVEGEWIWKEDVGTESNIEGEKGIFSDSFKRAGVMWSCARYLYDEPTGTQRGPKPSEKQLKFAKDLIGKVEDKGMREQWWAWLGKEPGIDKVKKVIEDLGG